MPDWLRSLTIRLIDPINGKFYVGVAGTGRTALEAFRYANQKNGKLEICRQERRSLLSEVGCILFTIQKAEHDTYGFTVQSVKQGEQVDADYSITFSPLSKEVHNRRMKYLLAYAEHVYGNVKEKHTDWAFAQNMLSVLKPEGKGTISMPSGALYNDSCREERGEIIASGRIQCVISLPPNTLPTTVLPINLVIFGSQRRSQILMIDADKILRKHRNYHYGEKRDIPEEVVDEIVEIFKKDEEQEQISKLVHIEDLEEDILFPPRYIEKALVNTELFGKIYIHAERLREETEHMPELGELGTLYKGVNTTLSAQREKDGEIKILKLSDVQDGQLDLNHAERYSCKDNCRIEKYRIMEGDLLFSCKGPSVKVCVVPKHKGDILISQAFIGFRLGTGKGVPEYLRNYFESPIGQYQLKRRQLNSSIVMLKAKDLERIPVIWNSIEKQQEIIRKMVIQEEEIECMKQNMYRMMKEKEFTYYQEMGMERWMQLEDKREEW